MEIDQNFPDESNDLSSFQKEKWLANQYLYKINGFWLLDYFVPGISRTIKHFRPLPSDVILASFPKTGTTWLKSLLFAIVNRGSLELLARNHPHELVPILEAQVYGSADIESCYNTTDSPGSRRIFSTHMAHQLLVRNLNSSECRVVYVTRNPKDTLVSMFHFVNKWKIAEKEALQIEDAVDKFCRGVFPCGPYYDHVLGYRQESLNNPKKNLFTTYEDLKADPTTQVKKMAEFLGCPFGGKDGDKEVEEVIKSCSFEILRNYEVNKSENSPTWFEVPYNSFFRKGEVGDHMNFLDDEKIALIDEITRIKFHGSGFNYGI
ncbi:transferase [Lithospermum erythrorhizon]|uniref:Sulfotransferase n=1 Tax=Lithospermum erythrorhizon TaxID=34254 RepID=A0AAV3RW82_LITER